MIERVLSQTFPYFLRHKNVQIVQYVQIRHYVKLNNQRVGLEIDSLVENFKQNLILCLQHLQLTK